jgi:hypothetical protein
MKTWNSDDHYPPDQEDSILWANLTDFSMPDTSVYWDDLCNGTNMSNNPLPGDFATMLFNTTALLADWKVESNSTCSEYVGEQYNDTLEAFKACGATCDGLVDDGCAGVSYKLCATGSLRTQAVGTCVVSKPADFVDPKGMPRPPQELGFWNDFCKYRFEGRKLRILFEGKNCVDASVKDLGDGTASSPVECAELAAKDSSCSKVFDFRFGPPSVCRCLLSGSGCIPTIADGGHVYAPSVPQ